MQITESYLQGLCKKWQDLLGLAHWKIEVRIVRGIEINNNCGQNDYSFINETSLIRLKTPDDYHGYFPYDIEVSLVHELLHIIFDIATSADNEYYEQALDRTARVLVRR